MEVQAMKVRLYFSTDSAMEVQAGILKNRTIAGIEPTVGFAGWLLAYVSNQPLDSPVACLLVYRTIRWIRRLLACLSINPSVGFAG